MIAFLPMLFALAHAGGVHAGIPVRGVAGLGEPTFLTPASGWTAAVDGGWVRVFVGATEAEGAEWYARQLESIGRTPAPYAMAGVDEAHGDGAALVLFREGNVGVVVRAQSNVKAIATRLRDSIVSAGPGVPAVVTPNALTADCDGSRCEVRAPGAAAIRAPGTGGVRADRMVLPKGVTEAWVWDDYGRVKIVQLEGE